MFTRLRKAVKNALVVLVAAVARKTVVVAVSIINKKNGDGNYPSPFYCI